jgi:hypothetical protein
LIIYGNLFYFPGVQGKTIVYKFQNTWAPLGLLDTIQPFIYYSSGFVSGKAIPNIRLEAINEDKGGHFIGRG